MDPLVGDLARPPVEVGFEHRPALKAATNGERDVRLVYYVFDLSYSHIDGRDVATRGSVDPSWHHLVKSAPSLFGVIQHFY